jgi:hypothetical protein
MQATKFIIISAATLLTGYLTLCWIGIKAGLATEDSYGVIHATNLRLQTGQFAISRPPGHPLSEDWMLPAFARLVEWGSKLSSETYGLYQVIGGLCCLGLFWLLLGESPISPSRRLLATACMVFSPFFLIESSDGEEFLWGAAFLFAALLLVTKLSVHAIPRPVLGWGLAVACAVAASGFRVEFGAVALGMVFWTLLASDRNWVEKLGLAFFAAVLLAFLWGPLLIHHKASQPFAIPLSLAVRFGVGLYKIIFSALGVIPLAVAALFFIQARGHFRFLPLFGRSLVGYWSVWLAIVFFILFFFYPMKPAVVFPMIAFLILLGAIQAGPRLWACFVLACLSIQLVQIDCFDNRAWAGLKFKPSLWEQSFRARPAFRGPAIEAASRLAIGGRHLIIADAWPWDFDWQLEHGLWRGVVVPESKSNGWTKAYSVGPGLVISRQPLDTPAFLRNYVDQGYDVWIGRDLYREVYMRYRLSDPVPDTAVIGGVICRVVAPNR